MERLKKLTQFLSDIASVAIAVIIAVTIADVLMKNLFNQPIKGAFELVEFMLVFVIFFGIAEIFRSETNICVDIIDHAVNENGQNIFKIIGACASLVFLLILTWAAVAPAMDTVTFPQWTQEIGISLTAFWAPILAGLTLAIIAAALVVWTRLRFFFRKG